MIEMPFFLLPDRVKLNGSQIGHHNVQRAGLHRKSHRDIDIGDFFRNGIQHRFKKILIRQDYRTISAPIFKSAHLGKITSGMHPGYLTDNIRKPFCLTCRRCDTQYIEGRKFQSIGIKAESLRKLLDIV